MLTHSHPTAVPDLSLSMFTKTTEEQQLKEPICFIG